MANLTLPLDNPSPPTLYSFSGLRDSTVSLGRILQASEIIAFTSGYSLSKELSLALCVILATLYLLTVRILRYRRVDALQKQFGYTYTQFQTIDYKDAQSILGNLFLLECPWVFLTGKDFAFLRVSRGEIRLYSYFLTMNSRRPSASLRSPKSPLALKKWSIVQGSDTQTQPYSSENGSSTPSTRKERD